VAIPKGTFIDIVFDCSITADQKLGFVAQLDIFGTSGVYVIDLDTISLASGTNPILVSSLPEYLSITPDGKYVVVGNSGSARGWPVSVIDMGADPYLQ
jgi:DNA-binding beta-propeller fold protein YncE